MAMRIRSVLRTRAVFLFVFLLALTVFLLIFRYAAVSDFRELAINRLQDDSYYYLMPAWNFPRLGFFTFDGVHPTYGFQPLWMIVLSLVAFVSPDKVFFLRAAVALGGFFFAASALPMFWLCRQWLPGWRAAIGPGLWLANPALAGIFITGKENALYAFLFMSAGAAVLHFLPDLLRKGWIVGLLLGLMVLARVNAAVPVLLFLILIFWKGGGTRAERWQGLGMVLAGMMPVLLLWGAYALVSFGTVFPNSGSAKLIDSPAALVVFAQKMFPWIPNGALAALLPEPGRAFLGRPDLLNLPTKALLLSYSTDWLPGLALGSWAGLLSFLGTPDFRLRIGGLALLVFGIGAWILLKWFGSRRDTANPRATAAVLVLLLTALSALVNTLSNWLLMPAYLSWGVWYTVPEMLALVLFTATAAGLAIGWLGAALRSRWPSVVLASVGILITGVAMVRFSTTWSPRDAAVGLEPTQQQALMAADWMNANLPAGSRVGSYSAGLLGYFGESYRVVNLDGLANSPDFIDRELVGHVLFIRGLAPTDPLVQYLADEKIEYLSNVDPTDRIHQGDYLGLVEPGGGRLLFEGDRPIDWGAGEPERRFIVVEILPGYNPK